MRKIIKSSFILTGIAMIVYSIILISTSPHNHGSYLPCVIGIFIITITILYDKIIEVTRTGVGKRVRQVLTASFSLLLLSFFIMCCAIYYSAQNIPEQGRDSVIVLGAGLKGEEVSLTLKMRLDKACEYLIENPECIVVVSGGQGSDEIIPEALAMQRYLIEQGIDQGRIIMEDRSTNTYENFLFSKNLLDTFFEGRDYSIVYITNDFHLLRAGLLANKIGLEGEGYASGTPAFLQPSNYAREYFAFMWEAASGLII